MGGKMLIFNLNLTQHPQVVYEPDINIGMNLHTKKNNRFYARMNECYMQEKRKLEILVQEIDSSFC